MVWMVNRLVEPTPPPLWGSFLTMVWTAGPASFLWLPSTPSSVKGKAAWALPRSTTSCGWCYSLSFCLTGRSTIRASCSCHGDTTSAKWWGCTQTWPLQIFWQFFFFLCPKEDKSRLVEGVVIDCGFYLLADHLLGLLGHCCSWRGNVVPTSPVELAVQRLIHLYDHWWGAHTRGHLYFFFCSAVTYSLLICSLFLHCDSANEPLQCPKVGQEFIALMFLSLCSTVVTFSSPLQSLPR